MRTRPRAMPAGRQRKKNHEKIPSSLALTAIYLILLSITHCSNSQSVDLALSIATATADVIREFFVANRISFDFIICGESSNHINDVIDRVTQLVQDTSTPITLKHIANVDRWDHRLSQSAVIFIKRTEVLRKLHKTAEESSSMGLHHLTNAAAKAFKFLVYTEEIKSHEKLLEVTGQHNSASINRNSDLRHFELFLTSDSTRVNLTANDLVLSDKVMSGTLAPRLLNSFDRQSQQWSEKLTNYEHYRDLRGCLMPFLVEVSYMMYIDQLGPGDEAFEQLMSSGRPEFSGALNEVLQAMAARAHFVPHITLVEVRGIEERYPIRNYDAGSSTVLMLSAYINRVSMNSAHLSLPFASTEGYYLVGPNDKYTNYQKLLFPFDTITWSLLLLMLTFTVGVIFGLFRCPRWIRTIVFGTGVSHPGYNATGIFFGISQMRLPREVFSRWILLMFLWFCLNIRTCFQSKMFEFMTSDMRHPLPGSIEDLRKMNYDIVLLVEEGIASPFETINNELISGQLRPRVQAHNFTALSSLYERALNGEPGSKLAFVVTTNLHIALNSTFRKSLPIMRNAKLTQTQAVLMQRNHVLLHHLNHVMDRLIPSGILQHAFQFAFWFLQRPIDDEYVDPKRVLSLNDLEFGFVLWLSACLISSACFTCEVSILCYKKLKIYLRQFAGSVNFLLVLRAFLDDFHDGC